MTVKAYFFDMGDTLIFDRGTTEIALELLYKLLMDIYPGIPIDKIREAWAKWNDIPITLQYVEKSGLAKAAVLLRRIGIMPKPTLVEEVFEAILESAVRGWMFEEDAVETLRYLKDEGYIIGIISNTDFHELVIRELKKVGLLCTIDVVVTSQQLGVKKPHPDIFNYASLLAGTKPHETVYVGNDPIADIQGAKKVGWKAIHKVNEGCSPSPLADMTINKIIELRSIHSLL